VAEHIAMGLRPVGNRPQIHRQGGTAVLGACCP
jgi:hypothetical protein